MALSDKDVDAEMAANWASILEKHADPEPEAAPEAPADAGDDAGAEVETIPVSREPDGKFKAKDDKAEKPVAAPKAKPATVAKTAAPAPVDPAAVQSEVPTPELPSPAAAGRDVNRPPSTWKPAARAEFDKLPPTIKAEIHRREADFLNGQAQLRPDAEMGQRMRQVIEPYRMLIEAEGGTPDRAVADLLRTAAIFRTGSMDQKRQAVIDIVNQFGVQFPQPGDAPQQQPAQNQFRDPRVDQLLHQQNLERQQAAQREQATMESTVNRWMNEVDAQGNPKREYLGDVINEMSALVPQIRQADPTLTHAQALDAAYDRAIWAHPEIRTLLAQKQQAEQEAQRRAENQKRVSDARKAGSVNVARRASTPSPGKPGTMDQTLNETARELGLIT
jgi:hypothetical protein